MPFNNFDFNTTTQTSQQQLIDNLKQTLNNPVDGEESSDIQTAIALIELFELSDDPVISKYFSLSIKDYPKLVSGLSNYSQSSNVNSLLNSDVSNALSSFDIGTLLSKGFSYDLPEPAHKAALKFENLSDALAKSFPEKDYVFRYWENDSFDGYIAEYLRVALLTSSAMLEFIAAYDYSVATDYGTADNNYTTVLVDPVSVLNSQKVFVFPKEGSIRYGDSVQRLEKAKQLLIEAMQLAQKIDVNKLPQSAIDYKKYLSEIDKALKNLTADNGEVTSYKYDTGFALPKLYINFQSLFTPDTVIDITDFGKDTFYYHCNFAQHYDANKSLADGKFARCSDDKIAVIYLDESKARSIDLQTTNFDELVVEIKELGIPITKKVLLPELFKTINTTTQKQFDKL